MARVFEVEDLVTMVRAGQVRIPEFQRPFRWGIEDARRLFDSIVRGYPLGSLLLWERPAKAAEITVGALRIEAPDTQNALWVVDGQQRVTVLANSLSQESQEDERFALGLDLTSGEIVPTNSQRPHTIPLPTLFDLQGLMTWFREAPELGQYFDTAIAVAKKIRQFKIPASVVESDDDSVLRDIFDRLNNYGKRLTRAEVFTALHPVIQDGGIPSSTAIEEIVEHLSTDLEFGVVDGNTIFHCILARRGPEISREMRTEFEDPRRGEFPGEDAETAYRNTKFALDRTVSFLQNQADTPHFAFLPYRHLLIVLTRFFAHYPNPDDRQSQLLRRWYWRAAAAGTGLFPGSNAGTTRALCGLVIPGNLDATLKGLLDAVPASKTHRPNVEHFRTNHATGKMIACALWSLGPRSLRDGRKLDRNDLMDTLGDAQTPRPALTAVVTRQAAGAVTADSAARWLLVPSLEAAPSEVPALLASKPIGIDATEWAKTLQSHVVEPTMAADLTGGRPKEFVRVRTARLVGILDRFMTSRMEFDFEDTPPLDSLILDDLEAEPDSIEPEEEF
jgi:hypothetical protein